MLQWVSGEDIDALFVDLSLSAVNPQVRKLAVVGLGTRQMNNPEASYTKYNA